MKYGLLHVLHGALERMCGGKPISHHSVALDDESQLCSCLQTDWPQKRALFDYS